MTDSDDGFARQQAPLRARFSAIAITVLSVSVTLSGCSSGAQRMSSAKGFGATTISPEYGVAASPRVAAHTIDHSKANHKPLQKGGGVRKVGKPYKIAGRWYTPREDHGYDRVGIASWYGKDFHGRLTANGEVYDMNALTAAHKTMPLPSYAYVTNLENNRTVLVRVNDRGPFAGNRIIDLSRATARALDTESHGLKKVRVQYAGPAPLDGNDFHEKRFLASQSWHPSRNYANKKSYRVPAQSRGASYSHQSAARHSKIASTSRVWNAHDYRQSLGGAQ